MADVWDLMSNKMSWGQIPFTHGVQGLHGLLASIGDNEVLVQLIVASTTVSRKVVSWNIVLYQDGFLISY